ncbi:hypothetical protein LEP1GSC072_2909 [Leptospira noguchii str. Bonito]|nr:hypothetical protein LEP1GSC072_2909 [Leptospira noguchii str. Bonito]
MSLNQSLWLFLKESYVLIFRKSLWDCSGGKVQNRKVGN